MLRSDGQRFFPIQTIGSLMTRRADDQSGQPETILGPVDAPHRFKKTWRAPMVIVATDVSNVDKLVTFTETNFPAHAGPS